MMKASYVWMVVVAAGLAAGSVLHAHAGSHPAHDKARLLAQGKYLVTRAVPCSDCHSPRDQKGQLIAGRDLQGAPIDFQPLHPVPGWVTAAPSIAGLPAGWTFDQTVDFLETGLMPGGGHAGPPMPQFRFKGYDATAIATYLESLPGPEKGEKQ
jgi:mono/diheme cytochrome c family protein